MSNSGIGQAYAKKTKFVTVLSTAGLQEELSYMLESELTFLLRRLDKLVCEHLNLVRKKYDGRTPTVIEPSCPYYFGDLFGDASTGETPVVTQMRNVLNVFCNNNFLELKFVDSETLQTESREWISGHNIDYPRWDEILATAAMVCGK